MYLSRIMIRNFRNFRDFDVALGGNVVIVGENRVGKSNLLFGLRLIFDPSLPDSSRQLGLSDFWDELDEINADTAITISVEIKDFEEPPGVLAVLTDFRLDDDPHTVRLTYKLRVLPSHERAVTSDDDLSFCCFGGESEAKVFGHDLRRRITMDLLPALRDAEGDLSVWRRSPLRPLIEGAFADVETAKLEEVSKKIAEASEAAVQLGEVKALESRIADLYLAMAGETQNVHPSLGFSATNAARLNRQIRLLIDEGQRGIADASLGSANLIFLTLKWLNLKQLILKKNRDYSLLAMEEPEAHLHPHLQRLVYKYFFEKIVESEDPTNTDGDNAISVILTTHSPHIVSVAPLNSLLLLRSNVAQGTEGYSTAAIAFSGPEEEDLVRYLDVTRAEMVFARGVILVEGDAERFLTPVFADKLGISLDECGVSVCSVAGTNFQPYVKLLCALGIPFAVITDFDDIGEPDASDIPDAPGPPPLSYNRCLELIRTMCTVRGTQDIDGLIAHIKDMDDYEAIYDEFEEYGLFVNHSTLETELFKEGSAKAMITVLRDHNFSVQRKERLKAWEAEPSSVDDELLLRMIEQIGKGRFAQRLASCKDGLQVPDYIKDAVRYVVGRV